jgi:transcriptional regulator with XRE-family HTH domain
MNIQAIRYKIKNSKLFSKLTDKKYRDLFVASQVNKGIPYQMRALRAARVMTQEELAKLAGTTQTVISRIENKGAGNLSVKTLLKLAEAFDVALVVRFESIDRFIGWLDNYSPEDISFESSEVILKKIAGEEAVPTIDSVSVATTTLHLKLVKSDPTAMATKLRTAKTNKQPSLFDGPLCAVSAADHLSDQTLFTIETLNTSQADVLGSTTTTDRSVA